LCLCESIAEVIAKVCGHWFLEVETTSVEKHSDIYKKKFKVFLAFDIYIYNIYE